MTALIHAYNRIRNIHYKIVDVDYSLSNSNQLIELNCASCTPKHLVLFDLYSKLGIETRLCVHEFQWADLKLNFPLTVSVLLKDFSADFHTNLEIKINGNWVLIDATWDDALIDAGLPGTKDWNGVDPTINAVYSMNAYRFNSIEQRADFFKNQKKTNSNPEKEQQFIQALNDYFETLRN